MSGTDDIAKNHVVQFHYDLRDAQGALVATSRGGEPATALVGHGNVMEGLEAALVGHAPGDRFEATLAPEDAFGVRHEDRVRRVSKKYVANAARLKPGMQARLETDSGARTVTVLKVGNKMLDVDLNHPLAGKTVTFAVEVVAVRDGTRDELAHGHVHGAGGHHH